MKRISLNVIDYEINNINTKWWKEIMSVFLKSGQSFEIRCWNNETKVIEIALKYGKFNEVEKSENEISINGILSEEMIEYILFEPKPGDYDKWTDFFTINVNNNFCSAHYGAEIYIYLKFFRVYWLAEQGLAEKRVLLAIILLLIFMGFQLIYCYLKNKEDKVMNNKKKNTFGVLNLINTICYNISGAGGALLANALY